MEQVYYILFAAAVVLCTAVEISARSSSVGATNQAFSAFRTNYVAVYCFMMAGDWLQGPYVYRLYEFYGYSVGQIGQLFIAGFGSSMVFGTVVGSLADRYGRKKASLAYVVLYIVSCITKHSPRFEILMLGRLTGGIATSLLYSAFESWLVAEHFQRGYPEDWLGGTFSRAVWFGNGLVAILCGLLANTLVENFNLGPVAPFDAAVVFLSIGGLVILRSWPENYGNSQGQGGIQQQLLEAAKTITSDRKVALLGAMQSLFEASMYTFVFLWTPALSPNKEHIPHGWIFSLFMIACMTGSGIAGKLMGSGIRISQYMQAVYLVGAACLAVPLLFYAQLPDPSLENMGMAFSGKLQLVGFMTFEVMVGIFWPSMMRLRSHYVPEDMRATIINCFRIPLNLFVCIMLFNVSSFPLHAMFAMCSTFLVIAGLCQWRLDLMTKDEHSAKAKLPMSQQPSEV